MTAGEAGWDGQATLERSIIEQLKQLQASGRPKLLADLIERFAADAQRQLATLRGALAQPDPSLLERAAHALKGSSRTLGAQRVADLCQQLELIGRAGSTQGANDLLTALEPAVAEALAALRAEAS